MPNLLKDIAITHISLVKNGANGKQIIYKSADSSNYEKNIAIKKSDNEKGVIYGIVYSPDEVDSQGDFTTAEEIEKAAYNFMKGLNANNVDIEHSFKSEDAFVAESWILKANDPVFPDEKEGSWAVAIKLESEELKELAKSGEISGLSMAGVAIKQEVEKSESKEPLKNLMLALGDALSEMWIDFGGRIQKSKEVEQMSDKFKEIVKSKLAAAAKGVDENLKELQKSVDEAKEKIAKQEEQIATLQKENSSLKEANKTLEEELKKTKEELEKEKNEIKEVAKTAKEAKEKATEATKVSKQKNSIKKSKEENEVKGVL